MNELHNGQIFLIQEIAEIIENKIPCKVDIYKDSHQIDKIARGVGTKYINRTEIKLMYR